MPKNCKRAYEYRRVCIFLEKQGIHHNSKTVLRVIQKYNLLSQVRHRKYCNYGGYLHATQTSESGPPRGSPETKVGYRYFLHQNAAGFIVRPFVARYSNFMKHTGITFSAVLVLFLTEFFRGCKSKCICV